MQVKTRRAREEDITFLGWAMYTAARSHLAQCPWSNIFEQSEIETRNLLERITLTPTVHWCHISKFWIAEADGKPAATMCGFSPATEGTAILAKAALDIARRELGYSEEKLMQVSKRLAISISGLPDDLPDVWGIENVAALAEYRGKGLID